MSDGEWVRCCDDAQHQKVSKFHAFTSLFVKFSNFFLIFFNKNLLIWKICAYVCCARRGAIATRNKTVLSIVALTISLSHINSSVKQVNYPIFMLIVASVLLRFFFALTAHGSSTKSIVKLFFFCCYKLAFVSHSTLCFFRSFALCATN